MLRRLTIERTTAFILFALLLALATRIPIDTDVWWHLRSADHTLTQGMIYTDPFSFTMHGQPWTNHSWGAQIILLGVWRLAGNWGLALYVAGLATAGMYLIYRMSAGGTYLRAFAVIIGAAAAAVFWSPRPQMLSFFLSTVVLFILMLYKRKGIDRLWLLPPIMALWGNLHAGFSIGFIFIGGVIAGEILNNLFNKNAAHIIGWRGIGKLILVALVSAAALLINPYGVQMLLVPFQTVGIGALRAYIQEWNPPNFANREVLPFLLLLIIVAVVLLISARKRRWDWTDAVLAGGTAAMGLLAGRNIAVFAVAATPILTYHLVPYMEARGWVMQPLQRVSPRMARLNAVLLGVVLLGALAKIVLTLEPRFVAAEQAKALPIAAAAHLHAHPPQQQMFNSYNFGGYLMYAAPNVPVFVDGRTDLYGDVLLARYLDIAVARDGWREALTEYAVDTVVIEPDSPLAAALRSEPGWRIDYEDDLAVIFKREDA
jgi:hypothetical protein